MAIIDSTRPAPLLSMILVLIFIFIFIFILSHAQRRTVAAVSVSMRAPLGRT
jgi:flagellar biogenesis protein FliO